MKDIYIVAIWIVGIPIAAIVGMMLGGTWMLPPRDKK